uniref:Uncharacterized protein n=1 Tax=Glossina pallidipes TaxID=7398 RepID=A0A1B0AF50_GLOPL
MITFEVLLLRGDSLDTDDAKMVIESSKPLVTTACKLFLLKGKIVKLHSPLGTVLDILRKNVSMKKMFSKWIPFLLTMGDKSDKTNKQSGEKYIKTDSNNNNSYSKPQQTCLSADI